MGAVIWSLPGDVTPTPGHVASIGGIQNFASNPRRNSDHNVHGRHAYDYERVICSTLGSCGRPLFLGALSYLLLVGTIEPLPTFDPNELVEGSIRQRKGVG